MCCARPVQAHAHAYTAVYLESALELGQVSPREVHSELLLIYLHMALEEEREGEARWVQTEFTVNSLCVE